MTVCQTAVMTNPISVSGPRTSSKTPKERRAAGPAEREDRDLAWRKEGERAPTAERATMTDEARYLRSVRCPL